RGAAATAVDPTLAVQSVAVAPGDNIGSDASRVVTVGFAAPVALPAGTYRVSVVFGAPDGARTRASFVATDGEPGVGTVETSTDGRRWTSTGATDATLEADALRITAPVGATGPGLGLWVEAQIGDDPADRSQSPVFSLDALLGRNTAGALPAAGVGTLTAGASTEPQANAGTLAVAEPVTIPGAPPTLTVDEHLTVTETEPVPATLAGQPVVNAIDEITFMPGYSPDGTVPAVVQINRTTGTIRALRGTSGLPTDRTGDGSFVVQGLAVPPPTPSATAPATVVLDLDAVAEALDLPLDPDGLGLGLRRKLTLADGRDVVGSPTMATLVWYETASPTAPPDTVAPSGTESTDSSSGSSSAGVGLAVAGAVGLALAALIVVLVVRRRRAAAVDRWLDEYDPVVPPDEDVDPTGEATSAPARVHAAAVAAPAPEARSASEVTIDAPPVIVLDEPAPPPGPDAPPEPEPEAEIPPRPETDPVPETESEGEPETESATESEGEPEPEPEAETELDDHRRSPADALASLEAQVSALTERVDRLPDPHLARPGDRPGDQLGDRPADEPDRAAPTDGQPNDGPS
ncbi:MAG: hypothetical protein ACXWCM_11770, partial [Acidimicrobiales bacterium]